MNLPFSRGADAYLKFVPLMSSADVVLNSSDGAGTTDGSSFYGNTLDLNTYRGFQSITAVIGVHTYQLSATGTTDSTNITNVRGHWVTDTSSGFGGSTAFGSTFTLTLTASSAQSSEMGVLVGTMRVDSSSVSRYVRFLSVAELSSGDGDTLSLGGCYILAGGDQLPTTNSSKFD
ncbi:MAG: hypothetical protein PHR30_16410 [Gallionellaceae bacterium]|nr:hypothetical protein [Gallionellaceae bacterium]